MECDFLSYCELTEVFFEGFEGYVHVLRVYYLEENIGGLDVFADIGVYSLYVTCERGNEVNVGVYFMGIG